MSITAACWRTGLWKRSSSPRRITGTRRSSRAVEAVIIATPDHWHAKIFVDACSAGKDIYLEKPIANSIREGRLMVEAARRTNRIVQVGLQQRSGSHFQRAVKLIQDGQLGDIHFVECFYRSASRP